MRILPEFILPGRARHIDSSGTSNRLASSVCGTWTIRIQAPSGGMALP
jgi:hypothetical protein